MGHQFVQTAVTWHGSCKLLDHVREAKTKTASRVTNLRVQSELMGHAKIRYDDVQRVSSCDKDVRGTEVAMDDTERVQVVHASRTLL